MTTVSRLFSLANLTLAGVVESLLLIKLFPSYYDSQSHITTLAAVFSFNYTFGALFWLIIYPKLLSPLRHLPGPRNAVSISHRTLLISNRAPGDIFLDLIKQYPGEEMLNLTALDTQVLITKPRLLADLLVHRSYDFIKPTKISSFLRHVLGDGLIIVEGNQHKFLRKNTMPAFNFRHIKNLYPMIWSKAATFTTAIGKEAAEGKSAGGLAPGVVELQPWASRVTLDIIGIAGLGRKFNMLQKAQDPLLAIYEDLLEPSMEKLVFAMSSFLLGLSFIRLLPWRMNKVFNDLTASLNDICGNIIQEKRDGITKNQDDHFDVLSLLIKSNNFSDDELKDQLLTFLAAGHETTASALTWASYLLSTRPALQEQLRDEVRTALPDVGIIEQTTDLAGILDQLPLLNGIIQETLRLYPTVPITMRQAVKDTRLGDQVIPKGTVVVLSIWLMNRSPEVWGPDAGEFRPERWIGDNGKPNQNGGASSNYEFLTFLHGPRSCIGQGFAKAEMRCLLAAMIGSFSWELAMDEAKVIPRGVITIKPASGLYLKLYPVKE